MCQFWAAEARGGTDKDKAKRRDEAEQKTGKAERSTGKAGRNASGAGQRAGQKAVDRHAPGGVYGGNTPRPH